MTQEEENQHIKKLKDAGFDCGSSRSMLETIQLFLVEDISSVNDDSLPHGLLYHVPAW